MPNHLCEDVELYALGGLEEADAADFVAHLATCSACQLRLEELEDVTDALLYDFDDVAPPPGMRDRVLANVTAHSQAAAPAPEAVEAPAQETTPAPDGMRERVLRSVATLPQDRPLTSVSTPVVSQVGSRVAKHTPKTWQQRVLPTLTAAAVVAIAFLGWQNLELRQTITAQEAQINDLGQLVATIRLSPVETFGNSGGEVQVIQEGNQRMVLVKATNLPAPNEQARYTLWVMNKGHVINGGTFVPHDGLGMIATPLNVSEFDTVAISLEPDAYSGDTPRGEPVMSAKVTL